MHFFYLFVVYVNIRTVHLSEPNSETDFNLLYVINKNYVKQGQIIKTVFVCEKMI